MTNLKNTYILGQQIQKIYSIIKQDDLKSFIEFIELNPSFLNFKNAQLENLLFYSLNKKSNNISQYLIEKKPNFIYEINTKGLNVFAKLIKINNSDTLNNFYSIINSSTLNKLISQKIQDSTIIILAITSLNENNWKIFSGQTEKYWSSLDLMDNTSNNLNIAHLIADLNKEYCLNLIPYLDKSLFGNVETTFGDNPLLLSCRKSSFNIFSKYLEYSNENSVSILGNNMFHYAAINKDSKILDYLLENNISILTNKNYYQETALSNSLSFKNKENSIKLVSYFDNINEEIATSLKINDKEFNKKLLDYLSDTQISNINTETKEKILIYLFKNFNMDDILNIDSKLNNILLDINEDNVATIYKYSLLGKKDMVLKVEFLLKSFEHNDTSKTELLSILPENQIYQILKNTNIFEHLNRQDYFNLYTYSISKQSNRIKSLCLLDDKKYSINEHNEQHLVYITKTLSDYSNIINISENIPEHFIHKISEHTLLNNNEELFINSINNKDNKKTIILSMFKLLMDGDIENKKTYFSNNKKLIKYYFEEKFNFMDTPNYDFFLTSFLKLDEIDRNKYFLKLVYSDNKLSNKIANHINFHNEITDFGILNKNNICKLFNFYKDTPNFNNLKKSYINALLNDNSLIKYFSLFYNEQSVYDIKDEKLINIISSNFIYIIENNKDLLDFVSLNRNSIYDSLIVNGKYSDCSYMLNNYNDISNYKYHYKNDFSEYLSFINLNIDKIDINQVNIIITEIFNDIKTGNLDYNDGYYINSILSVFNEQIEKIDNNILLDISNYFISNDKIIDNTIFNDKLNGILNLIFKNKDVNFLKEFNNKAKNIINENPNLISKENMAVINYNILKNDLVKSSDIKHKKLKL